MGKILANLYKALQVAYKFFINGATWTFSEIGIGCNYFFFTPKLIVMHDGFCCLLRPLFVKWEKSAWVYYSGQMEQPHPTVQLCPKIEKWGWTMHAPACALIQARKVPLWIWARIENFNTSCLIMNCKAH